MTLQPKQFIHRGTQVEVDDDFSAADDATKARMLLDRISGAGHHWSRDEQFARDWTTWKAPYTPPSTVHVALTAEHPGEAAVETDPGWLERHGVGTYQNHEAEQEVPLRGDAVVPVRRVSWWERHPTDPADGVWHDHDVDPVAIPVKRRSSGR